MIDPRHAVHVGPFVYEREGRIVCWRCGDVVTRTGVLASVRQYWTGDEAQRIQISRSKQSVLNRAGDASP